MGVAAPRFALYACPACKSVFHWEPVPPGGTTQVRPPAATGTCQWCHKEWRGERLHVVVVPTEGTIVEPPPPRPEPEKGKEEAA